MQKLWLKHPFLSGAGLVGGWYVIVGVVGMVLFVGFVLGFGCVMHALSH